MPDTKKHMLKNVNITRIAIVKNPAVTDSSIVLMKSADAQPEGEDALVKSFGERLLEWLQQRLAKSTTPTTENPDMDLQTLKIEELESARPDLVKAIADKNKPADTGAAGAPAAGAAGTADLSKADPFAGLKASLDALRTEFTTGFKVIGDRVEKLEKAEKPAPVDVTALTKSIADLDGKIETLSKAGKQGLEHGADLDTKKDGFGGVYRTLRKSSKQASR